MQDQCKLEEVSGLAQMRLHAAPADEDSGGGVADDEDDWEAL